MPKMNEKDVIIAMKFMMTLSRMDLNDDPWAEVMCKIYDMDHKITQIIELAKRGNTLLGEIDYEPGDSNGE